MEPTPQPTTRTLEAESEIDVSTIEGMSLEFDDQSAATSTTLERMSAGAKSVRKSRIPGRFGKKKK
jgi:hypothetical protein